MPFLVVPRELTLPTRLRTDLAARLCPYTEAPRPVLESDRYTVWATSLAAASPARVANLLDTGTASFELVHEQGTLRISTDPLGVCPIWYARMPEGWIVSPEAKAIAALVPLELESDTHLMAAGPRPADWSPYRNVRRLPPGAHLRLAEDRAELEGAPLRFATGPSGTAGARESTAPEVDWPRALGEQLIESYRPAELPTGAFISGGIDSSVACALARRHGPVASFSLGTQHGNEFPEARSLAEGLDCEHAEVLLPSSAVLPELARQIFRNEVFDGLTAEILLQFGALYAAAEGACGRVVTGYGSDLLFDGMLSHAAYMEAVGLTTTVELIERTRWTGELAPFDHWARGIAATHVFWEPDVIARALQVPRELCSRDGVLKHVLRRGAVVSGLLPERLAFREKLGLSDGTRANRLLSDALDIEADYGYADKTRHCIERWRRALA